MYIYNYMHIWRAARNVKITPANNYGGIHDGRNGFVIYDIYITLVNQSSLPSLDAYKRYSSALKLFDISS